MSSDRTEELLVRSPTAWMRYGRPSKEANTPSILITMDPGFAVMSSEAAMFSVFGSRSTVLACTRIQHSLRGASLTVAIEDCFNAPNRRLHRRSALLQAL